VIGQLMYRTRKRCCIPSISEDLPFRFVFCSLQKELGLSKSVLSGPWPNKPAPSLPTRAAGSDGHQHHHTISCSSSNSSTSAAPLRSSEALSNPHFILKLPCTSSAAPSLQQHVAAGHHQPPSGAAAVTTAPPAETSATVSSHLSRQQTAGLSTAARAGPSHMTVSPLSTR